MPLLNKDKISLGFWVAIGFFLFGLIVAAAQYLLMRAERGH